MELIYNTLIYYCLLCYTIRVHKINIIISEIYFNNNRYGFMNYNSICDLKIPIFQQKYIIIHMNKLVL